MSRNVGPYAALVPSFAAVLLAQRDRVHAELERQIVHHALDREG